MKSVQVFCDGEEWRHGYARLVFEFDSGEKVTGYARMHWAITDPDSTEYIRKLNIEHAFVEASKDEEFSQTGAISKQTPAERLEPMFVLLNNIKRHLLHDNRLAQ
jgi:hypothetical protein